ACSSRHRGHHRRAARRDPGSWRPRDHRPRRRVAVGTTHSAPVAIAGHACGPPGAAGARPGADVLGSRLHRTSHMHVVVPSASVRLLGAHLQPWWILLHECHGESFAVDQGAAGASVFRSPPRKVSIVNTREPQTITSASAPTMNGGTNPATTNPPSRVNSLTGCISR